MPCIKGTYIQRYCTATVCYPSIYNTAMLYVQLAVSKQLHLLLVYSVHTVHVSRFLAISHCMCFCCSKQVWIDTAIVPVRVSLTSTVRMDMQFSLFSAGCCQTNGIEKNSHPATVSHVIVHFVTLHALLRPSGFVKCGCGLCH